MRNVVDFLLGFDLETSKLFQEMSFKMQWSSLDALETIFRHFGSTGSIVTWSKWHDQLQVSCWCTMERIKISILWCYCCNNPLQHYSLFTINVFLNYCYQNLSFVESDIRKNKQLPFLPNNADLFSIVQQSTIVT
jgi:hypothetical protein